jgi:hypothetical protein
VPLFLKRQCDQTLGSTTLTDGMGPAFVALCRRMVAVAQGDAVIWIENDSNDSKILKYVNE